MFSDRNARLALVEIRAANVAKSPSQSTQRRLRAAISTAKQHGCTNHSIKRALANYASTFTNNTNRDSFGKILWS